MVDTLALEASAERRVGSSPTWGTILGCIQQHKMQWKPRVGGASPPSPTKYISLVCLVGE